MTPFREMFTGNTYVVSSQYPKTKVSSCNVETNMECTHIVQVM